ncbi:DNA replication protein [Lactobacillus sp. CBA3605]|uniref:ATP-binding protein n=1 Tax=Lactobacillus sp. CBA3605 TaxID=2099788 RepID=UPI000CFE1A79|nr:ATP-binding protein [Lactobacillus sp. CBA3605]AVK60550.1 DNA replication protein [Lactobacillus sp. CBA3605]
MKRAKELFDLDKVQAIAVAKGIDMSKLPTKEQLDEATLRQAKQVVKSNYQRYYRAMSVWSGNVHLQFKFKDWDVQKQSNIEVARKLGNQAFVLTKQLKSAKFNVLLSGVYGVGKTSLALAIADQLRQSGQTVMFVSTAELLRLVNDKYEAPDVRVKLIEITQAMKSVDVLILDDFGTEGGKATENGYYRPVHRDLQAMMYQVANARCDFERNEVKHSTIVTTNNTRGQLENMYDTKIVDRLLSKVKEHQLLFDEMKGVRSV